MKNILAGLTLAVSATTASACTELQEHIVKEIQQVFTKEPRHKKACIEGNLFYTDTVTAPLFIVIDEEGTVGICHLMEDKRKIDCKKDEQYKENYKKQMEKRSI